MGVYRLTPAHLLRHAQAFRADTQHTCVRLSHVEVNLATKVAQSGDIVIHFADVFLLFRSVRYKARGVGWDRLAISDLNLPLDPQPSDVFKMRLRSFFTLQLSET